jgi:hypothetical protein
MADTTKNTGPNKKTAQDTEPNKKADPKISELLPPFNPPSWTPSADSRSTNPSLSEVDKPSTRRPYLEWLQRGQKTAQAKPKEK